MRSVPGLTLTVYTATEVDQIFRYLNVEEKFNPKEAKQLCGCNPLLISYLHCCNYMDHYAKEVQRVINSFIDDNLSVVRDVNCVTDFFCLLTIGARAVTTYMLQCKNRNLVKSNTKNIKLHGSVIFVY